jgi:hypothetical protein
MRIFTGSRDRASNYRPSSSAESSGLRKSELLSDIFNNQPAPKGQVSNIKLRLSHFSRTLSRDLRDEIKEFLNENPSIAEELDHIYLPEHGTMKMDELRARKLAMYNQWVQMGRGGLDEGEENESLQPYITIHQEEKDEEIGALFEQSDQKRRLYRQEMERNAPNYYYQAYPETYAFN